MNPEGKPKEGEVSNKMESLTIKEDAKEEEGAEDEEGMVVYPYDRLKTSSDDPITDIDITKREVQILPSYFTQNTSVLSLVSKKLTTILTCGTWLIIFSLGNVYIFLSLFFWFMIY